MGLRKRAYLAEITTSGAVPPLVKPFAVYRRAFPTTLSGIVDKLTRSKKRLAKKFSKMGPPLPPKV